jgi:hypothetical protein
MHRLTAFMSANPESPLQTTYEGRGQVYYKGTDGKGSFKMDRENWDENYS